MSQHVLIVDDSLTIRMALTDLLVGAGLDVIACETLSEARALIARGEVALVLLDVNLPDGDGIDLLLELRASDETRALPVFMLSTRAEVKDRIRGAQIGANDYVGKPYDDGYVLSRVLETLRTGETRSSEETTVLLIDDSVTFREALREALVEQGYRVLTAGDGEEGLRMIAAQRPDAVVVDGVLPGVDGATVIRRVRLDVALRATPCLLLTGSDEREAELRALDAGADAFVRKEDPLETVLVRLAAVLRGSAGTPRGTADDSALGPQKILAIDDSQTYLQALRAALRGEGYDVVLASSGEEALELLAVQSVDCILLDLVLPGLSGHDVCRLIRETPFSRDIPIIMLSSRDEHAAMIEGLRVGADDYISKASDLSLLKAHVRAQLRRKRSEAETRRVREDLLRRELEMTEARAAHELASTRAALVDELERKNAELEAFSYSVSHDLRAPLRSIDGFSQALLEDYEATLDSRGQDYLRRVRGAAQRMGELIDDLLELSRVGRHELARAEVDPGQLAASVLAELEARAPERRVERLIAENLSVNADPKLLRIVLENLLGNAWKFTGKSERACIELNVERSSEGERVFFVRDNGAGFDMRFAERLFRPFQRLHAVSDFAGTGIGPATVARIVDRHGGRVWAEGSPGQGATFRFTLPDKRPLV